MIELAHIHFVGSDPPRVAAHSRRLPGRSLARVLPVRRPESPEPDPFLVWLLARAGLEPALYESRAMERRLAACLRAVRTSSTARAKELIALNPALQWRALNAVLIGVSEFFRDPVTFDVLGASLATLAAERGALRVLSAGCSSGQELYSVAIQLHELGVLGRSELLGIDCRPDAIAQARRGVYAAAEIARISAQRQRTYFRAHEEGVVIHPDLRSRVRWQTGDLLRISATQPWDVILCRNVAIYLGPAAAMGLWERLAGQLSPGGLLVTGRAERLAGLPLHRLASSVYCKPRP